MIKKHYFLSISFSSLSYYFNGIKMEGIISLKEIFFQKMIGDMKEKKEYNENRKHNTRKLLRNPYRNNTIDIGVK